MEEYKMRRGEYLEERVPDLEATVEEYFGPITDTEKYDGSDLHVVEEPDNPVFDRIVAGAVSYSGKKDKLAVEFHERELEELMETGDVDAAGDANDAKNDFLLECTGRDAKSRRESMKRSVEDSEAQGASDHPSGP
jgi:carboxypeptidase C (cathepsin A)